MEFPAIPGQTPQLAAFTRVQAGVSGQATTATTVTTGAFGSALTVGSIVIVGVSVNSTSNLMNCPTDNASGSSNVYRPLAARLAVRVPAMQMFWAVVVNSGATTVTATCDSSATIDVVADEFSGQKAANVQSFAVVNKTTVDLQSTTGGVITVTIPATTIGNTLIVTAFNADGRTVSSATDNGTGGANAYTKNKENGQVALLSTVVVHSNTTVSVTFSSTVTASGHIDIAEFSGGFRLGTSNVTTPVHSQTGGSTGTAAACTSMGSTAGALVIAAYVAASVRGWTEGSGYSRMSTGTGTGGSALDQIIGFSEYKLSGAVTETGPATISVSVAWTGIIVEFMPMNDVQGTGGAGSAATVTSSTISCNLAGFTPTAGSLIVVFATSNGAQTYTGGSGYTLSKSGTNAGSEYLLSAGGGPETAPFGAATSLAWEEEAFEIYPAAAAVSTAARKTLLGVGA